MDLSWPHPPAISINGCTPKDIYRGCFKKMHLPTANDMADLIRKAGRGSYMFCCNIARAYRQLSLDPVNWPLVCLKAQGKYFVDMSLPFGLCWVAACCMDVTTLITRALMEEGIKVLAYIDDFGGVAQGKNLAGRHFK